MLHLNCNLQLVSLSFKSDCSLLENVNFPQFNERKEKTKPFIGAAVKEPQYGRSGWTLTFDLTSLKCMGLQQAIVVE